MSEREGTQVKQVAAASGKQKTVLERHWGQLIHRQGMPVYGWTLAATAGLLLIMFVSRQIWPFGDRMLLYTDGDQYFSFLGYVQSTLYTRNDLLFSWSTVLGGNMLPTYAYYASSPFNFLSVFFPGNLLAAYHFIYVVKSLAAGLCFAVMLQRIWPDADIKPKVLFAASYPFIGYVTYFAWNQSWMDGVILLPLVALGIWQIVQGKSALLYAISLALALIANFYSGYILALASVLLFASALVLGRSTADRGLLKTVGWFVAASAAAVGLAAVILLPVYISLPQDRIRSVAELWEQAHYLNGPEEVLSMLFTAPYKNMSYEDNYPIIYTGIMQLVLAVLLFLNPRISGKKKAVCSVLLLIMMLSFMISVLNSVWQGSSQNIWFNYRYSFLVSFLLELMAFCSFIHLPEAAGKLPLTGAVVAVILAFALGTEKTNIGAGTLLADVATIFAALILLHVYIHSAGSGRRTRQTVCFALIAALTFGSTIYNTYAALAADGDLDVHRQGLADASAYTEAARQERETAEIIADDGFYRRASDRRFGRNDPMLFGWAGAENYASSENNDALVAADHLGLLQYWRWARYDDNVPLATDSLLGLKYLVTGETFKADYYTAKGQISGTELTVWENPLALPVLFPAEARFGGGNEDLGDFSYMNGCWNSVSSAGCDIFVPADYTREEMPTSQGIDVILHFQAPASGPVYAYLPKGDYTVDVPLPSGHTETYDQQDVFYLGTFAAGEQGALTIHAGSYEVTDGVVICSERLDVLAEKAAAVQARNLQIDEPSSSKLLVQQNNFTGGIMATSIPYNDGWHAYVDGQETEVYSNMVWFLAFDVPAGQHEIELVYRPPYFWAGMAVSLTTLGVFLFLLFWFKKGRPRDAAA